MVCTFPFQNLTFHFVVDYHMTKGYVIVAYVIHVDVRRHFIDIYFGLLGNVNDFKILQKYGLYRQA